MKKNQWLVMLLLSYLAIFMVGFQADNWIENMVLEHDSSIATHGAIFTKQYEAIAPATAGATLPSASNTPTSTRTLTPTALSTSMATATAPPPTQEIYETAVPTGTNTITPVPTQGEATCSVRTNDKLTKRVSPGVDATSAGTVDPGVTLTIYPYSSSIVPPNQTSTHAWWYVRVADSNDDPWDDVWVAYAKTVAPRLTPIGVTPAIQEVYFTQLAGESCIPSISGLSPAPSLTPVPAATSTPVPTSTPVASNMQPFSTQGNRVLLNGEPFKFVGVNFRELIGYDNRIMPYASPADVITQLDGAKALGMRVVRFYVSHQSLTADQAIPRVRHILDLLKQRDMYAILVLTDGAYSGFEVADNNLNRAHNGIDRYTHRFFEGGYRENYLPYVESMTAAIGAHPAIYAWEPGNEFTTIAVPPNTAQMDAFINFYVDVSAIIRHNSPGKLISSGLESCWQLFVIHAYDGIGYCERLYTITDIGTIHTYQENTGQPLGSSWMHIVREMQIANQPLIIEETNTIWENESPDWLAALVRVAFNRLSGLMHWNMSFPYARDLGVGDGAWNAPAGSRQSHRWFNITGFYRALADQLRLQY